MGSIPAGNIDFLQQWSWRFIVAFFILWCLWAPKNIKLDTGLVAIEPIPVDVINNVTGERNSMNPLLAYDGEFGFTATLTINMESKNTGLYANMFYYNEQTGKLEFSSVLAFRLSNNIINHTIY